jgi:hypothetical protein
MTDQQPGTDVAVVDTVDAEIVDPSKPFSVPEAQAHDKKIRQQGEKAQQSIDKYLCLIEEAIERQIHVGLEISGLREYFDTLPKIEITDPDERKAFVSILNGKGLSQRQIAAFTGTNVATVNRDVAAGATDETPDQPDNVVPMTDKRTTGRDGKSYPAKGRKAQPKATPATPTTLFRDSLSRLQFDVGELTKTAGGLRFPKSHNAVEQHLLPALIAEIDRLETVADFLRASLNGEAAKTAPTQQG